ncbi:nicotinate-nucleotide diphosphorylase (carboxylating), partial [Candidatus Peregrinibacteria bacterium]|nr:nicotinate-nucleotide diphosphorylase (carboxylating) [Candidatus Peregrinibacteria bacterium]
LLQRMSGVATATNRLASKLPKNIKLLATRKTFWGLLDKRAVALGGGLTHRLHLFDAILIKDNHLALQSDVEAGLKRALKLSSKVCFVEIELQNPSAVRELLALKLKWPKNFVVMLDNFKPADVKKTAPLLARAGIAVEISGGINGKNIKFYCLPGVSVISVGAITNKAPALDISLEIL